MRANLLTVAAALMAIGLASCSSGGGQRNERLSSVLKDMDTGTQYAATKRCLSTFEYDNTEVLDDQHILFTSDRGSHVWLNTLRSQCSGLKRRDTLLFKKTGDQLCNLDTVEAVHPFLFWQRTGPVCTLGRFNQLTPNQAELIRQAAGKSS